MISFENDYNRGAHPKVLEALCRTNLEPCTGYGGDRWCASAAEKIRAACECPEAEIFFLTGGTQTNSVVIASLLREYEGVIAAETGHISVHEAGAVEGSGHKVLTVPQSDGKIRPETLEKTLAAFWEDDNHEHMVFPGMVYLSWPTETGTLYSKDELTALHGICRKYGIPLYLDGARLAYGLVSPACDLTLPELAKSVDVFYIGGTKCGALCGEAVVFPEKGSMPAHFLTTVKRHGALLAKGRLIGVQFDALFTDGLYFEIGKHAMAMAEKLKQVLADAGCTFAAESPTNQQYILMDNEKMKKLAESAAFSFWEKADGNRTVIRFVTSWGTTDEEIAGLADALAKVNSIKTNETEETT